MSLPLFLADAVAATAPGESLLLDGEEGRHAAAVQRLRAGEQLWITDGAGALARAVVTEVGRQQLTAEVLEVSPVPRPDPAITVVQALAKGDRGERAVELLTEIGVDRIVPWASARAVAVWRGDREEKGLRRWRATARAATKQSRRAWMPEVTDVAETDEVADLVAEADLALVLHEEAADPIGELEVPAHGSIVVVVGPEGGISPEELELLGGAADVIRLGSEVLRTSTAGAAAVAALLSRTPRWS